MSAARQVRALPAESSAEAVESTLSLAATFNKNYWITPSESAAIVRERKQQRAEIKRSHAANVRLREENRELLDQNERLLDENERLRAAVPPQSERGPWVFAPRDDGAWVFGDAAAPHAEWPRDDKALCDMQRLLAEGVLPFNGRTYGTVLKSLHRAQQWLVKKGCGELAAAITFRRVGDAIQRTDSTHIEAELSAC